jgi:4-amino-4-deoxy-L-arabinose transferase
MEYNTSLAALIFTTSLTAFCAAYYFYRKKKVVFSLGLIIFAGFLLRLHCALDTDLHQWDERFHALVAKNMIDAPLEPKLYSDALLDYDYKSWGKNYIWLHKQPLPFWIMGFSMHIFGVNAFFFRLPSLILSTVLIGFTFLIGKKLYDKKVGLLAAFFHAINGLIVEIASGRVPTDHVDTFFFFFVELSILLIVLHRERKTTLLLVGVGVATGMAILSKWLPGLISIPIFLALNFNSRSLFKLAKQSSIIVFTAIAITLPWQVYAATAFPLEYWWENGYNLQHFSDALGGQGKRWWYHIENMGRIWNEIIFLAFPWFIWKTFRKPFNLNDYALLTWIILPYLIFSFASTKMQGYVLFTAPAFFVILSLFVFEIEKLKKSTKSRAYKILSPVLIGLVIVLSLRFGIERVKPFKHQTFEENTKSKVVEIDHFLADEKCVVFNVPFYIETMFYTNHVAYKKLPSSAEAENLIQQGEHVYVIDDGKLPQFILENNSIQKFTFLK